MPVSCIVCNCVVWKEVVKVVEFEVYRDYEVSMIQCGKSNRVTQFRYDCIRVNTKQYTIIHKRVNKDLTTFFNQEGAKSGKKRYFCCLKTCF